MNHLPEYSTQLAVAGTAQQADTQYIVSVFLVR